MTLSKAPTSAASTTLIRGGMKQLQQFFQNERERFTASPILLLVNQYPPNTSNSISTSQQMKVQINAIQQVQYILQQKLGYQTFVATCGKTNLATSASLSSSSSSSVSATSSYYPTQVDVDNALKLSQKLGAYNIVAVGTGNVMDVGKAMYQTHDLFDELLCIPTTYGASMVSTSSHALLYDSHEDTLIPQPTSSSLSLASQPTLSTQSSNNMHNMNHAAHPRPTSIFSIDDIEFDLTTSIFDTITNRHITLLALLSIILDNIYQDITIPSPNIIHHHDDNEKKQFRPHHPPPTFSVIIPNEYIRIVDSIMSCLDRNSIALQSLSTTTSPSLAMIQEQHQQMLNLCYEVGSYISYGLPVTGVEQELIQPRSIPIAMVASLSSKASNIAFSQYTAPTIMASFALSYCELIIDKLKNKNLYTNTESTSNEKKLIRHLETLLRKEHESTGYGVPKIITTESVMSLLSTIQTNQMIWNCYSKSHLDGTVDYPKLFRHHLLI